MSYSKEKVLHSLIEIRAPFLVFVEDGVPKESLILQVQTLEVFMSFLGDGDNILQVHSSDLVMFL